MNAQSLPGPDDITRRELANGIVVLVRENHHVQSIFVTGSVNAGSLFDPVGQDGLAAFTASMLLRGTHTRSFNAFHELLESNGASLSLNSGRHTVGFSGKSLAEDLPLLLDLLADSLQYPAFVEEQVARLRGQIVTGIKIREQSTRYVASRIFRELAYADHPYQRQTDGTVESVERITRRQLIDFHGRHFGPAHMVIIIVGAVDTEVAIRLVEEKLGDWQNPDQPGKPEVPEAIRPETIRTTTVPMPGKSQSDIVLGWPGPSRFADDWQAANLGNSVLGLFGMYGRIGAEVREKHGMAYYSYSRLSGGLGPGPWQVLAGVNPANVDRAVALICGEIRRFVSESVSEEELADNKANMIGRLPLQLETNEGVAGAILTMVRYELGLDYLRTYEDVINAVKREEILAAAQRYLSPDAYVLGIAGPG